MKPCDDNRVVGGMLDIFVSGGLTIGRDSLLTDVMQVVDSRAQDHSISCIPTRTLPDANIR